jgi:hypothetical protein
VGIDAELLPNLFYVNAELRFAGPRGASQAHYYLNDSTPYDLPGYADLDLTLSTGRLALFSREQRSVLLVSGRNLFGSEVLEPGYGGVDIPQVGRSMFAQLKQEL